MADNILSDFGINILEEEIDDVIFQTNEFLCDATFTGTQGPFWWILQMCMALAALFAIIMAGIWGTAVYTSHHYIIDVTLGICCALLGILLFEKGLMKTGWFKNFFNRYYNYIK